jgi:hypothetical protein
MDIPDRFTVDVTAEDIAAGTPQDCARCPVAIALNREQPHGYVSWVVTGGTACLNGRDHVFTHNGFRFVWAFDEGGHVSPRTITFNRAGH